jgi:hypothetical protein
MVVGGVAVASTPSGTGGGTKSTHLRVTAVEPMFARPGTAGARAPAGMPPGAKLVKSGHAVKSVVEVRVNVRALAAAKPSNQLSLPPLRGSEPLPQRQGRPAPTATVGSLAGMSLTSSGPVELLKGIDTTQNDGPSPPDDGFGVGPTKAVLHVNSTGAVYDRSGNLLQTYNLSDFFGGPVITMTSPFYSDPRVVYDAPSGRWFATILIFDSCGTVGNPCNPGTRGLDSEVDLAVSINSDPQSGFDVYKGVETTTDGTLLDQPKLGVSGDKAVITINRNGFGGPYEFQEWSKADLLAGGASIGGWVFGYDSSHYNVIPAYNLDGINDEPAMSIPRGSSTMTVFVFQGTPSNSPNYYTYDLGVGVDNDPPGMTQPNDSRNLDAGTAGIQSAVYQGGIMWGAGNDACNDPNNVSQSCIRIDQVNVYGDHLNQDINIVYPSGSFGYPGLVVDTSGNLYIGITASSSTNSVYASQLVLYAPGGTVGSSIGGVFTRSGSGPYDCTFCVNPDPRNRWGDYAMAARDPNNGNDVWLNNEWGSASTTNTNQWATETAEMTNFGPSISSLGQDFGNIQGGQTIDIYGSEFVNGGSSVYFGAYQSPNVTFVDSTHIQATTPEVPNVGAYTVSVSTADGNADGQAFYYFDQTATGLSIGPNPSVDTQPVTWVATVYPYTTGYGVPGTAPTGTVYFYVDGSFYTSSAFNGSDGFGDPTATVTGIALPVGAHTVYAYYSGDSWYYGSTSATSSQTVSPLPAVTSVSPSQGPTAGGNGVTISGSSFTGATSVTFGGVAAAFTFSNDSTIKATAPAGGPGTVDVVVSTCSGGCLSATSSADHYTYVAAPAVTSVAPNAGPLSGAQTVTISGAHFTGVTAVAFGTTAASFSFVSDTTITAKTPSHAAGIVDVRVSTAGGPSPIVTADRYVYEQAPTIKSVVPDKGPLGGGQAVTIVGTNFTGATHVTFGTSAATSVVVVSSTKITAKTPAHVAGVVDVRVTTPVSSSATTAADHYTYVPAPTIASVSPTHGTHLGNTTVTIIGTHLTGATAVLFTTTPGTSVVVVSDTKITVKTPAHAVGVTNVRVTTAGGTSAIVAADRYTFT